MCEHKNKYVVFWYPTLFHTAFDKRPGISEEDIKKEEEKEVPIEDGGEPSQTIQVTRKESSKKQKEKFNDNKVNLCFTLKSEKKSIEFRLICEERSNNGFVVYSYNPASIPTEIDEEAFFRVVYQRAKSLYHKHEIYDGNGDHELSAYISNKEFDPIIILRADNPVLQFYLEQFEEKLKGYATTVSNESSKYADIERKRGQSGLNEKKRAVAYAKRFPKYAKRIADTNKQIGENSSRILNLMRNLSEDAMIEYAYATTLLKSKYNTVIRTDISFSERELLILKDLYRDWNGEKEKISQRDRKRKIAVNIEGSINYLRCIISRCNSFETRDSRDKIKDFTAYIAEKSKKDTIKWAIWGAVISAAIGAITSIILHCNGLQ